MRIHFNGSPNPTVGVEVELQIIDPETKNLVSGASRILERVQDINRVKPELIASTVELNTDVCANIETVRCELSDRLRSLLSGENPMSKGVGEMVRSRSVQVKASAGTEGARRAIGVPADGAAGEAGPMAPGQRWSVGRSSRRSASFDQVRDER